MQYFEHEISGIDGTAAKFVGYCLDNSEEVIPDYARPSVLVIPGGGYEMTSDREAEPIAMQFLAAGYNTFVLRYSVKPSVFPVALLEAAEAMKQIREHAAEWHVDTNAIAVIGFSAGGHLAANLATSASDEVIAAHGYDPDAVRPNGLMLAYPVITSGPLAHRGSFDSLLGNARPTRKRSNPCPSRSMSMPRRRRCSCGIPFRTTAYRMRTRLCSSMPASRPASASRRTCSPAAAMACRSVPPKRHGRVSTASRNACRCGRSWLPRGCVGRSPNRLIASGTA